MRFNINYEVEWKTVRLVEFIGLGRKENSTSRTSTKVCATIYGVITSLTDFVHTSFDRWHRMKL